MLPLFRLLNINTSLIGVEYTSSFIIEFRETIYPEVRFIVNYPEPYSATVRLPELARPLKPCTVGGIFIDWCPLVKVLIDTRNSTISDPGKACDPDIPLDPCEPNVQ